MNYVLVLHIQQDIAHCHVDLLVYYRPAQPASCQSSFGGTDWLLSSYLQQVREDGLQELEPEDIFCPGRTLSLSFMK